MKIAISTDNGSVSAHFGRCPEFTIIDIENGKVLSKELIQNPGHHPGYLPEFLQDRGVDCIVAGGMGQRAQMLFAEKGIQALMGVSGSIDDIVDKLKRKELKGGESLCSPGAGKGYGVDKTECEHEEDREHGQNN